MSASGEKRPIIIVKKVKKGGGGHHGGSWKVAYADFVTAMMAFFMVMWLVNLDSQTKSAISGYFINPSAFVNGANPGVSPLPLDGAPQAERNTPVRMIMRSEEQKRFEKAAEALRKKIEENQPALGRNTKIEISITEQGLRIELVEGGEGDNFFPIGSAVMSRTGQTALGLLAPELIELSNPLVIEGHTDAARYGGAGAGYSNWELSADRANAARRILEGNGLRAGRIVGVRGLADRYLKVPESPYAAQNRRISILLPFTHVLEAEAEARTVVKGV